VNSLEKIDWQQILNHLSSFATSQKAKAYLAALPLCSDQKTAIASFQKIEQAKKILVAGERPYMESLDFFYSWFERLKKNALLKPIELKDIRYFLIETQSFIQIIKPIESTWFQSLLEQIMDFQGPLSTIDHLMTPDGQIRLDASETLYKLHNEKNQLAKKIQNTLDKIVKNHEHESDLQDKYVTNREGRWVLPVKSGMRHNIGGIIHASSGSKQTVFMEPQAIIPLNNRIRQIEIDIEKEVNRLLQEVSDYLYLKLDEFTETYEILLESDIILSQGQLSNLTSSSIPEFSDSHFDLIHLKHPLMVLNGETVIPNSLNLDQENQILILTGPNAGGKTVLLKSLGLAAHMARCGLHICVESGSRIPFLENLHIAVGDNQSVDNQLSTFASHLKILNEACEGQGSTTLILIDEICGSTDPEEGAALARGFIDYYSSQNSFALITSHLGPLKVGWSENSGIANGSMNYDTESGRATYQFIKGIPGKSLAFATAKKIGIRNEVYQQALEALSPEGRHRLKAYDEIEDLKKNIEHIKNELREKITNADKEKLKWQKLMDQFEKEKEVRLESEIAVSMEKFNKDIQKKNINNVFSAHESRSMQTVKKSEVIKSSSHNEEAKHESIDDFLKSFPPGSIVFVPSLNQDGIVQGDGDKKERIPILAGSMRLLIHWQKLRPPKKNTNPLKKKSQKRNKVTYLFAEQNSKIDLRGLTVEEAIAKLELSLESLNAQGSLRMQIVHGHGNDSLKKATRAHLSRSVLISRWQAGSQNEGGDGITWAYFIKN